MFKIDLGSTVKDKISGYQGLVIGRAEWLYGCRTYTVKSQTLTKEGKPTDSIACDEDQLLVIKAVKQEPVKSTGGPRDVPSRADR
jgi:hypothetical protein